MNLKPELSAKKTRKQRVARGHEPLFSGRAPVSVLTAIRAKAAARNVCLSVVLREALSRYVESDAA